MKILVIEDELEIRELLSEQFRESGIIVDCLENGNGVIEKVRQFRPDVVVLDQMMPIRSGKDVIQDLRSHSQFSRIPVMMLTGLTSEEDKVSALNLGADDYVTKPFSVKELVARAQALYRRVQQLKDKSDPKEIVYKDVMIDLSAHRVFYQGKEIHLTLTEYKILVELLKIPGEVLTRDALREKAMGNINVSDRTIDVHMASLRKKLDSVGNGIETVRGVGYRVPA